MSRLTDPKAIEMVINAWCDAQNRKIAEQELYAASQVLRAQERAQYKLDHPEETLADAKEQRPWRSWAECFMDIVKEN